MNDRQLHSFLLAANSGFLISAVLKATRSLPRFSQRHSENDFPDLTEILSEFRSPVKIFLSVPYFHALFSYTDCVSCFLCFPLKNIYIPVLLPFHVKIHNL